MFSNLNEKKEGLPCARGTAHGKELLCRVPYPQHTAKWCFALFFPQTDLKLKIKKVCRVPPCSPCVLDLTHGERADTQPCARPAHSLTLSHSARPAPGRATPDAPGRTRPRRPSSARRHHRPRPPTRPRPPVQAADPALPPPQRADVSPLLTSAQPVLTSAYVFFQQKMVRNS